MPCVNLINIRTYRSSLKTNKKGKNKAISAEITEQNSQEINQGNLAQAFTQPAVITNGKLKRNSPIRRMQFGMPLMIHAEIKSTQAARRLERKLAKQLKKSTLKATRQAAKAAKQLAKQNAKTAKQAARDAKRLAKRLAKIKAEKSLTKSPTESLAATQPTHFDEPILLRDGDVIKIHHARKPMNFYYLRAEAKLAESTRTAASSETAAETSQNLASENIASQSAAEQKTPNQHIVYVPALRQHPSRAELINAESRIGSQIFGPIPTGHRREFFHHQRGVWIWHEDWTDEARERQELTVRYEVRLSGIYKKVAAGKYFKLEGAELANFRQATHTYLKMIKSYLYRGI